MNITSKLPLILHLTCCLWLILVACYRPAPVVSPRLVKKDLGQIAYDALANRAGVVILIDPRYGHILRRVARGTDVQFSSSPFELAQIITAYAALDAGIINEKSLLPCDETGMQTDVVSALSRPCLAFFNELSRRLSLEAFARAADVIGFTYYGIDSSQAITVVRPISAPMPAQASAESFAALATRGVGMQARDLHFAQLAASLASGATAAERFAVYIAKIARAPAPPMVSFNRQALAVIQRGLVKAVDEGEAKAAANIDHKVAGKMGSGEGRAIFVSYAPAKDPEICLVVYLKEGMGRDAAEVAGKFYQAYFGRG
jgi:hypothetical protein